ncbi:MAG: class I SAM-dependent methyltransferase [Phycisphaerae bacterium]|nr:class I SAM-dependent methyltransferase [Phycisphaerae bacterium]
MDGIYRYQRYIYDLTRKYFLLGRDTMLAGMAPPPGGTVLEIGCGTGRNLIVAARRYPQARFYGFDISEMMLETARANIARAGLGSRIAVTQGDATDFSSETLFGVAAFDRVFISYSLSMIPPWRQVVPKALAAVKPGGSLHIVDFGQQAGLPKAFRAGLHAWLAKFDVTPRPDLEAVLREAALASGADLRFERLFADYAQHAVLRTPA